MKYVCPAGVAMDCHAILSATSTVAVKDSFVSKRLDSKSMACVNILGSKRCTFTKLLLLITVLSLGYVDASASVVTTHAFAASESVAFKLSTGYTQEAYNGGSEKQPVALRSISYIPDAKQPYEWWLKFNLSSLVGYTVKSASLSVSKCQASTKCPVCRRYYTCSCPIPFPGLATPSCGGGSLDESYPPAGHPNNDDLTVWHIPSIWNSSWTGLDWMQSFSPDTADGVEHCNRGTGGSKRLSYCNYLHHLDFVGEASTAALNVTNAFNRPTHANDMVIQANSADVSFRLTVNGSEYCRFFVPVKGDRALEPKLTLKVVAPPSTLV